MKNLAWMRSLLFLLFALLNAYYSFGQNPHNINEVKAVNTFLQKGDSLKLTNRDEAFLAFRRGLAIALDNSLDDLAARAYKKIGVLHHIKGNLEKAEFAYRKGLVLDSISANTADLYYNLSLIKTVQNQQDSILFYLEKSIKLYDQFVLDGSAFNAYLKAGVVYKDRQLYRIALDYTIKAYNGFKQSGDLNKLADATTTIGNIQNQLKRYNQAIQYHSESLTFSNKANNNLRKGIAYTNLASVYKNLKRHDSAIANYKKAMKYLNKESSQYAVLLNNLANSYRVADSLDLSETYFKASAKANRVLKDTTSLLYNFNGLSSLYLEKGSLNTTRAYLDSISNLLPSVTDRQIELNFYENSAEFHQNKSDYKSALTYQKQYNALYEELYDMDQTEIVQTLQAKFDYESKENEILRLTLANKNNQLQLIEKNEAISKKNITLLILALAIILSLAGHYVFLQRHKVKNQKVKIEKLEAIYQGQEAIKKRIARDLHDIITTNFDGFRLRVLALKRSSKLDEMVDGITHDLKMMNQQIRLVSHRLSPLEMYMGHQKFTDIIKSRLSEFQLYGNIFVELENQFPDILNQLDITIQNNFYGIFLEILNNIEKHSMATKVKIKNKLDAKNKLHFVFEDNGIGIERNHKEGIGLLNIKQRVEILDGGCHIRNIETGTQVHIHFPISTDL